MHGAGNDFIVLNNCADQLQLNPALIKRLADRHFGIGADQVLVVESSTQADFKYRIFNADGQEVQQCGNGARCFAQYVFDKGLTQKNQITVETLAGIIQPELIRHNWVKVNMGPAEFEPAKVPFVSEGLLSRSIGGLTQYKLPVDAGADVNELWVGVASMGNPHVVLLLEQPGVFVAGTLVSQAIVREDVFGALQGGFAGQVAGGGHKVALALEQHAALDPGFHRR